MSKKNLLRKIGGALLGGVLLLGVAAVSSSDVEAQRGFHGGGFHRGGFHNGGFHSGFRGGFVFAPRFGYGYYGYPYGYPYGYGYYNQYFFGSGQSADNQGYSDGFATGANDARRGQSYNPERSHYFKDGGFGNFSADYRQGFLRGYAEGFRS